MLTLNQVLLLQQKVESAVEKIQQLQLENDALRNKCAELTNALSNKSEQLSSYQNDQNQIEDGILRALDRLDSIENSVLKAGQVLSQNQSPSPQNTEQPTVIINNIPSNSSEISDTQEQEPNFDSMEQTDSLDEDNQDDLGFDIF